jgi:hypothetical protein
MEVIKITDKKVVDFYKSHPELNVVTMNLIFIDILDKLSSNLASNVENTVSQQILGIVSDMRTDIKQLHTGLSAKLIEVKREYIEDVKVLLANTEHTVQEKVAHSLERNLDSLTTKTTMAINDVIPTKSATVVEDVVKKYTERIMRETAALLAKPPKEDKRDGLEQLEASFSAMITSIQTLTNTMNTTEARNASSIQTIQDKIGTQKQSQDAVFSELGTFLNKYKNNSSIKGAVSEIELYYMLQQIEPYAEIVRCSGEAATCDLRMRRLNSAKPLILFESKDYAASVNTDEVAKFERDLQTQKCHGIFVSQNSPITFKENFHIDIIDGIIHVYLSNVKYDAEIVKTAIAIVDNLAARLSMIVKEATAEAEQDQLTLTNKDLEDMKNEYTVFATKRTEMAEIVKNFAKQMYDKIDELHLPVIRRISGADPLMTGISCSICNNFWGKNQSSLSAHKRKCAKSHGFVADEPPKMCEDSNPVIKEKEKEKEKEKVVKANRKIKTAL